MSFGFAIGDFIAVGQLAQSLYKDVYLVALEELRLLLSEMATLSQSINLLIEEVKSPTSTLIRAGESRVKMVNEMMKQANATLKDLERFAKKYDFGDREGGRAKLKRTWDKLKFAREKSSIDELRSKVQYHNGAMNLLLTSAGNSSLERMESFNKQMREDIGGIQELLGESSQVPVLSTVEGMSFQITLSQIFLKEAERVRPWRATGLDEWINAGRWWLMKSQDRLYSYNSTALAIPTQAYADLLKASWILIDIISKHPQQRFWSHTGEYLQVQLLVEMLRSELEAIKRLSLQKPGINEIELADLRIWAEVPRAVSLRPSGQDEVITQGLGSWHILGEEVYFQSFGLYRPDETSLDVECMILVLVDTCCKNARLVAQSQKGVDLLNAPINMALAAENDLIARLAKSSRNRGVTLRNGQLLCLNTDDDFLVFKAILVSALYCFRLLELGPVDHRTFHSLVLLTVIDRGARGAVERVVHGRRQFSRYDEITQYNSNSVFESIWSLAGGVAEITLNSDGNELGQWILSDRNEAFPGISRIYDWFYRLLKAPATILNSPWVSLFHAYRLSYERVSLLHAAFHMAVWRGNDAIVRAVITGIVDWSEEFNSMDITFHSKLGIHSKGIISDSEEITALEMAVTRGHLTIVQLLLDHEPESTTNADIRRNIFHIAAERGHEGIARLLLDRKVDVAARTSNSWTALHLAAGKGYEPVARVLLENGADVDSRTSDRWTPLHLAVWNGHKAVTRLLLSHSASVAAITENGDTALHQAAGQGDTVVARLLLDYGADIAATSADEWTALHVAANNGKTEVVELLLESGANIEKETMDSMTALYLASREGQESTVRLLLEKGADIMVATSLDGINALHSAVDAGHESVVRLLLEKGANILAKTYLNEDTALHFAVNAEHESMVRILVEAGADVTAKNFLGYTPLGMAKASKNEAMVSLLAQQSLSP